MKKDHLGVFESGCTYDQFAISRLLGLTGKDGDSAHWVVRNLLHAGLPFRKLGSRHLISGDTLNAWVRAGEKTWQEWNAA